MSNVFIKVPYAVSSKADGSMKKTDGRNDLRNIEKFLTANNLSQTFVCMEQVHGGDVAIVTDNREHMIASVDGLITNNKGISLCVVTADCLPILLHDPKKEVVAVAHAGSKGLQKNIIQSVLNGMKNTFCSEPQDIIVSIGPSIEMKCYEVGEDFSEQFQTAFPNFSNFIIRENNRFYLDLRNVALQCLMKEGILKEHIEISNECTKCNIDTRYSYRRGDTTERFVSVINLE